MAPSGGVLGDGVFLRHAVDGGGGREDQPPDPVPPHRREERHGAADVDVVVAERLGHRLAHGLQAGEVNHGLDPVAPEELVQRRGVADVAADQRRAAVADGGDGVDHPRLGVGEVVEHHDLAAGGEQLRHHVRPDVPCPAGGQNRHPNPFLDRAPRRTLAARSPPRLQSPAFRLDPGARKPPSRSGVRQGGAGWPSRRSTRR